ncbi:MAG: PEP-CTERM sorting domain-containing protein [Candidatus Rokuibacteriota bacterium]
MSLARLLVRAGVVGVWAFSLTLTAAIWAGGAQAATISIQPIMVCDDGGVGCAANPLGDANYEAFTDQILHQLFPLIPVGDTVEFLDLNTFNSTLFNTITCTASPCPQLQSLFTGVDFMGNPVPVDRGQAGGATPTPTDLLVYNMWFVDEITSSTGTIYGFGAYPGNGSVIHADEVIAADRFDTIAHELAHNFGFAGTDTGHIADENFLMAAGPGVDRLIPTALNQVSTDGVTGVDRLPPASDVPAAEVNTQGDTPFQNQSFFNFAWNQTKPGVSLTELVLDITPIAATFVPPGGFFDPNSNIPPGADGFPLTFLTTNNDGVNVQGCAGLTVGGIGVAGNVDGGQVLTLSFADGAVTDSCSFSFSIDIDLNSNIDGFGATPAELERSVFEFSFSNGYNIAAALDGGIASTVFNPLKAPVAAFRIADPDTVPLPGTLVLVGLGGLALALWRRRSG